MRTSCGHRWYADTGAKRLESLARLTRHAQTAALTAENYEYARTNPVALKYRHDQASLGTSYAWRHGTRAWREGRWAPAVAWHAALPALGAITAVCYAASLGLLYPILRSEEAKSTGIRSDAGVREDVVCRRLRDVRYALKKYLTVAGQESMITGETTRQDVTESCNIARTLASDIERSKHVNVRLRTSTDIREAIEKLRRQASRVEAGFPKRVG